MHITELRIRHFRNFLKARLCFRPGVNTLIGENGSGKTNALYALRLLLDETLSRNAIHLRETDFCRELGRLRGHWIVVSADFADLDPSDGCQLLRHNAAHMDASNTGTYTFFFRPKPEVRKKLHELSELGDSVEKYLEDITIDDYEPLLTGRARANFLDDEVYYRCVGNAETGAFPNPEDDDQDTITARGGSRTVRINLFYGNGTVSKRQKDLWVATSELPKSAGHPFYLRLSELFDEHEFEAFVEGQCEQFYAPSLGRPSLTPGIYFRSLLIGYFEGIDSERGVAWRLGDSLSLRRFLAIELDEQAPDHSTISRTRRLIDLETHRAVFTWALQLLAREGLLSGGTIGVDATTLEANAAMRSLVRCDSGEGYEAYLRRRALESGS